MDSTKKYKVTIALLGMALLASCGVLGYYLWLNHCWKVSMDDMASQAGLASASLDFRKGNMVLWVDEGTDINVHYSGRHDGRFEVWVDAYYPDESLPMGYARRKMHQVHNENLRYMYDHPDKFKAAWKLEPRSRNGESRSEDK